MRIQPRFNLAQNIPLFALSALCLMAPSAQSSTTIDGGITTTITTPSAAVGFYYVGVTSSSNTVNVISGGQLGKVTTVAIGENGNSNNFFLISGLGSAVTNSASFRVGDGGSSNHLTISSQGVLSSVGNIWVGDGQAAATGTTSPAFNNSFLLTDPGSAAYSAGNLIVGGNAAGSSFNSVIVSNGATLTNLGAYVGQNAAANSNSVLITDTNSFWLAAGTAGGVFLEGIGASITISNGATANLFDPQLGVSLGNTTNTLVVTGPGSFLTNSTTLYVGAKGSYNALTVNNGGKVATANIAFVGANATSAFNSALVTGANSLWQVGLGLWVGGASSSNQLTIAQGGTVTTGDTSYISTQAGSVGNHVLVTDAGSVWNNSKDLSIGATASGNFNQLVISNSGVVIDNNALLGNAGSSNSVLVTGTGSTWTHNSTLNIGNSGSYNSLTVTNGGLVSELGTAFLGYNPGASSNSVMITGAGSVWTNGGDFYLGNGTGANFNQLVISNSGVVVDNTTLIGNVGNNNTVLVTGAGSVLTNNGNFYLGNAGSSNSLTVANGGAVIQGNSSLNWLLGVTGGSSYNQLTVSGATSSVSLNQSALTIGYSTTGTNNTVNLVLGGQLTNVSTLNLGGISSAVNVGDGTPTAASLAVGGINLSAASARLNINNGVIFPTSGTVTGPGSVNIGSGGAVINTQGSSLFFASSVGGVGALTEIGGGLVVLQGANTYTGGTVVNGGYLDVYTSGSLVGNVNVASGSTVEFDNANALNSGGTVTVVAGATVTLNYSGTDYIAALTVDGVVQPPGVYGAGATNPDGVFTGGGTLSVGITPPKPSISNFQVSGSTLTLSATNGTPNGTYYVLESTNLSTPASLWNVIFTNTFDGSGNIVVQQVPVANPSDAREFFILSVH